MDAEAKNQNITAAQKKHKSEPERPSSSDYQVENASAPRNAKKQKMSIGSLIHSLESPNIEKQIRANTLPSINNGKLPGIAGLLNESVAVAQPLRSTSAMLGYQPEVMGPIHQGHYVSMMMGVQKAQPLSIPVSPHHQQQMTALNSAPVIPAQNYYVPLGPRRTSSYSLPPAPVYNTQLPPKMPVPPQQQKIESGQSSATLKYSHKMAERKRRKDMNDTFSELRALLPFQHGNFSKWEILNGATEHIENLKRCRIKLMIERETLHRELGLPAAELIKQNDEII